MLLSTSSPFILLLNQILNVLFFATLLGDWVTTSCFISKCWCIEFDLTRDLISKLKSLERFQLFESCSIDILAMLMLFLQK